MVFLGRPEGHPAMRRFGCFLLVTLVRGVFWYTCVGEKP